MRRDLTKSAEDNKRKGVANDPLSNGSKDHEDATEKEICSWIGAEVRLGLAHMWVGKVGVPVSEAPVPPAPLQPMRSHDKGVRLSRKPTRALHNCQFRFITITTSLWIWKLTWVWDYQRSSSNHP